MPKKPTNLPTQFVSAVAKHKTTTAFILAGVTFVFTIAGYFSTLFEASLSQQAVYFGIVLGVCFITLLLSFLVLVIAYQNLLMRYTTIRPYVLQLTKVKMEVGKLQQGNEKLVLELNNQKVVFRSCNLDPSYLCAIIEETYKVQHMAYKESQKNKSFEKNPELYYRSSTEALVVSIKAIVDNISNQKCQIFLVRRTSHHSVTDVNKIKFQIIAATQDAMKKRSHLDEDGKNYFNASHTAPTRALVQEALKASSIVERQPAYVQHDIRNYENVAKGSFNDFNKDHNQHYNTALVFSLVHNKPNVLRIPEGFLWIDAKKEGTFTEDILKSIEPIAKACYSLVYTINEIHKNHDKK